MIDALGKSGFSSGVRNDYIKAATINLAHGYLLCSIKYGLDAFSDASTEYNSVSAKFKFSKNFNSFSRDGMIMADWDDFIEKGLITKAQLNEFNKKYKILSDF